MTSFSDERAAELREIFFESAQEILQAINEEALRLEKNPGDLESLRGLRRAVHTLKGDAAACGYKELSHLSHEFEDVLVVENLAHSSATVETALTAADVFAEMLEAYRLRKPVPSGKALLQMIAKLAEVPAPPARDQKPGKTRAVQGKAKAKRSAPTKSLVRRKSSAVSAKPTRAAQHASAGVELLPSVPAATLKSEALDPPPSSWTTEEDQAIEAARLEAIPVYLIRLNIDAHCAMLDAALQIVRNIFAKSGRIHAFAPSQNQALETTRVIAAVVSSNLSSADLGKKCRVPGIVAGVQIEVLPPLGGNVSEKHSVGNAEAGGPEVAVDQFPGELPPQEAQAPSDAPKSSSPSSENLLRVDSERIDNVLNLVGELIIGRSMFQQTLLEFGKRFPKDPLRTRFADAFAFQSRVLNDLQRSVMKIRMVPVEQLFRRFPRLVRDTARICGKNVELSVAGQETDLDKGILDALAEPVAHLVRNSISHGIESPEERVRAGKPQHGTLRLAAYHQGNQVVIEIADDGRGLDADKIRDKAVARGLISAEDSQRLNESDLLKLIFVPGFSTAEQVTEVSGRGVGLDVVQTVLQRLKGSVGVETNSGRGSVFRLRLPLTLAIIKAILFRVEHRLYAVPLNSVAEMTRVHQSEIHLVDGHEVMQLRGQVLTLIRLGRPAQAGNDKLFVLVVSHAGQKIGLVVDELSGQEELVIKALDTNILSSDLISGVSILGDGRVVLILNLASVAERRTQSRDHSGAAPWGMLLPLSEMRQFEDKIAAAGAGGVA